MYSENVRTALLDGALADHKTHYAGCCRGYYTTLTPQSDGYRVTVNAFQANDPGNASLYAYLERARSDDKKIAAVGVSPRRFYVVIKSVLSQKKIPEQVNGVVGPILQYLAAHGYTTGCGSCGSSAVTLNCWQANAEVLQICDPCAQKMEQELKANQKLVREKKASFFPGLLGALLGAVVGSVAWILLSQLGYIAGLGGLAIVFCSMMGYKLLGGHLDRKGVICAVIFSIVMVYLANRISWSFSASRALADYGVSFSDVFRNFWALLKKTELVGSFVKDLVIGYLLTALASFWYIRNALRESTGGYTFKKIQ